MTKDEALQMALDALNNVYTTFNESFYTATKEAISTALAQPEPKPVAWMYDFHSPDDESEIIKDWIAHSLEEVRRNHGIKVRPLYTSPPKREEKNNG